MTGAQATVLVTGGAGYIGGQTTLSLLAAGFEVCVLDDLSTGRRLPFHDQTHFYEGRIHDMALVQEIMARHNVRAVLHFAGSIKVDESVSNPLKYYDNNTDGSRILIAAAVEEKVEAFIFSSTAAVYGTGDDRPVDEHADTLPLNPYGWSKLFTERQLMDVAGTGALKYGVFRYFNVAGADTQMRHGQFLKQPVHLIGRAIDAVLGRAEPISIFGRDLPTEDGTGVRDYIHVCDLADAHVLLLAYLLKPDSKSKLFNLGYGRGYSVLEVLETLSEVAGSPVPAKDGPPRAGEAASVVADSSAFQREMNWQPKYPDLKKIIFDAYEWQRRLCLD